MNQLNPPFRPYNTVSNHSWEIKFTNGEITTITGTDFVQALLDSELTPFVNKDVISIIRIY